MIINIVLSGCVQIGQFGHFWRFLTKNRISTQKFIFSILKHYKRLKGQVGRAIFGKCHSLFIEIGRFTTIFGHFLANCMFIFHKNEVQKVDMMC